MSDIEFNTLLSLLPKRTRTLSVGTRLRIPAAPSPFVAPTLRLLQPESENPLAAEVIFIKASAAVGKSTIANQLSAALGAPLLDLAHIPVSTGSLKALLLDISGAGNPISAFHAGKLPIIIDALDEGRLLSGEQGFESFLETTGEFLNENRGVSNRAKLIFLGRYDSAEVAELWLDLVGENKVTICELEVSFFGEEAAWKLIHAYAEAASETRSAYRQHPEPVRKLIKAYFDAIESALGIDVGQLWIEDQGKAFAGYAPVLAAMGSLLSQLDNFQDVANKLKETGATKQAWEVIEAVLMEITAREKNKLCDKAAVHISGTLPPEAYDTEEQLTLLSQFVHGQPLKGSGRVRLTGSDQAKYQEMVKGYIPEHPFVRHKEFSNAVLGSVVVGHAILCDLLDSADLEKVAALSRQPFLWRAMSQKLIGNKEIRGQYLGYILNSFWNDPIQLLSRIEINSADDSRASVTIFNGRRRAATFMVRMPIAFYAQIKDCEVDIVGDINLLGEGPASSKIFYVRGISSLMCTALSVESASVRFEGDTWFEAERVSAPPLFRPVVVNGTKIGWGGDFLVRHPWNEITPTLQPPYEVEIDDTLTSLVIELAKRTFAGGTLVLNDAFEAIPEDPHMRWAIRKFSTKLPTLIKLLIKYGMASFEPLGVSDQGKKVKVQFEFAWWDLVNALEHPTRFPRWESFITEARRQIHN